MLRKSVSGPLRAEKISQTFELFLFQLKLFFRPLIAQLDGDNDSQSDSQSNSQNDTLNNLDKQTQNDSQTQSQSNKLQS